MFLVYLVFLKVNVQNNSKAKNSSRNFVNENKDPSTHRTEENTY